MTTWNDPCPECGAELYCAHRPDPARAGRALRLVTEPVPPIDAPFNREMAPEPPERPDGDYLDTRYRATKMLSHHGKNIAAEWQRGSVHGRLVAAPMRSLAVPGEPFTNGQWTEAAWMTYLVWETGQDPLDGGLLERHYDRVRDTVTWHPVGSATVTADLGEAVRLVLSITDARTWEA